MKNKSIECKCGMSFPKDLMIEKTCYLCTLQNFPPRSRRQYKNYCKAVSVRLCVTTPLTLTQAKNIVNIAGLLNLKILSDAIVCVKVIPGTVETYYQLLLNYLKENTCGE